MKKEEMDRYTFTGKLRLCFFFLHYGQKEKNKSVEKIMHSHQLIFSHLQLLIFILILLMWRFDVSSIIIVLSN